MLLVAAFLIFLVLLTAGLLLTSIINTPKLKQQVEYFDYDWSDRWTPLDRLARKGNSCKPEIKIHRKLGHISTWVWMMPRSCEDGLPHTRGIDVVALPSDMNQSRYEHIMAHEKIHLLQRMYPDSWKRFYRLLWDYEIYSEPPSGMDKSLIEMKRGNPDTSAEPWCCWKKQWWPVPVYTSRDRPSIRQTKVRWWNQNTMQTQDTPPDEWVIFFGQSIHQLEHPHEITAEFLSGPLLNGGLTPDMPPAMLVLRRNWMEGFDYPTTK